MLDLDRLSSASEGTKEGEQKPFKSIVENSSVTKCLK